LTHRSDQVSKEPLKVMAFTTLPPELRSLCRRLTSTEPDHLPPLLPILLKDTLRCQELLSAPQDAKGGQSASEIAVLVHKLKTQVLALLNGRSAQGRFAGAALAKAIIEVGGWECLRSSEPWVRAMLSIIQVSAHHLFVLSKEYTLTGNRKEIRQLPRIYAL
jgi:pre-rRNA-processing protein RIX1